MAQPRKVDRPVRKNICLPESLVTLVDLELFSEVEGKVPFGAWQEYVMGLIRADLGKKERPPEGVKCLTCATITKLEHSKECPYADKS